MGIVVDWVDQKYLHLRWNAKDVPSANKRKVIKSRGIENQRPFIRTANSGELGGERRG